MAVVSNVVGRMRAGTGQNAGYQTYRGNVKLAQGQSLGFTKGRGYYARPAGVAAALAANVRPGVVPQVRLGQQGVSPINRTHPSAVINTVALGGRAGRQGGVRVSPLPFRGGGLRAAPLPYRPSQGGPKMVQQPYRPSPQSSLPLILRALSSGGGRAF